jgi:Trypsin-like peptidase domain
MARAFLCPTNAVVFAFIVCLPTTIWAQQSPVVLRAKQSTAFIKVTMDDGGSASGSGFFAIEPGIVITNAHVLGMLEKNSKPPKKIEVFVNSGETNEMQLDAKILGVDRSADLAAIRVEGKLPNPLPLGLHTEQLYETMPVVILGFPLGEQLGKNVTVTPTNVTALRKEKGVLEQIQVFGGIDHGNSGGPVVNARGEVIGVSASGFEGTPLKLAIPATKIQAMMGGRVLDPFSAGLPFRDGDDIRMPMQFTFLDPLKKIQDFRVEVWAGNPSDRRPVSPAKASPQSGDGPRQTYPLKYTPDAPATADVLLPKLGEGQVAWVQPVLVYAKGLARYGEARHFDIKRTVERVPASLIAKFEDQQQRTVHLKTTNSFSRANAQGKEFASVSYTVELDVLESLAANSRGALIRTGFGTPEIIEVILTKKASAAPDVENLLRRIAPLFVVNSSNQMRKRLDILNELMQDFKKLTQVQTGDLFYYYSSICYALQGSTLTLPNKEVKATESWESRSPMSLRRTGQGGEQVSDLDMAVTCTYAGMRTVSGKREALVSFSGQVKNPNRKTRVYGQGPVSGIFAFDLERGFITWVELESTPDLPEEYGAYKIRVSLTRSEGNLKNIELPEVDKNLLAEAESQSISDVQSMMKKLAQVKVENEHLIPIRTGKDGNKKIFGNVPAWLQSHSCHFIDEKAGFTQFSVESDGIVLMAVSPRFRAGLNFPAAGGVFANLKEPWYSECKSRQELVNEGWQETGSLPILDLKWPLYYRDCKYQETFRIRTEKELAPIIIK